jgi:predicted nucleic acid-binding Zn ribbon protein
VRQPHRGGAVDRRRTPHHLHGLRWPPAVFSPVGIVFKGSGFYRTDSRGKPAKADGDGDKAKKPADATSSSKSSTSEGGGSTSKPKAAEKSA